jgi:hypothetical protein
MKGPVICRTTALLGTAASGGQVKLYLPGSGSVYAGPHASVTVVMTPVGGRDVTLRDDERQFHQGAIPERRRCVRELVRPDRLPNPVLAAARSQVITGVTWVRRPVDAGGHRGANASLGGVVPGRQTADAESRALPLRFWHGRYPSFWNTVGVIKTNADGLLFWCFDEAAHFPDK